MPDYGIYIIFALVIIFLWFSNSDLKSNYSNISHKLEKKTEEVSSLNTLIQSLSSDRYQLQDKNRQLSNDLWAKNNEIVQIKAKHQEAISAKELLWQTKIDEAEATAKQALQRALDAESILNKVDEHYKKLASSQKESIPWLAGMMADFLTYELEIVAKELDWGSDKRRLKKVSTIREIRAEAARITAQGKEAIYQLEYLRSLFPNIDDYLDADYKELVIPDDVSDFDPIRGYLSKDEWDTLSTSEKNQLALDRYIKSQKTKWQIGRDYELSVAYEYEQHGYIVDTFGSYMQLEDHGRDLIAKRNGYTHIIQCKYWSSSKTIHENHLFQLYGSVISYCVENNTSPDKVKGVFITNISLSPFAEKVARYLNLYIQQRHPFREFPRIKCNIGKDEHGNKTYIYHLPMDAQYDKVKISNKGEFYAFTVKEAENAGFRRTYKWHGNSF